MKLKDLTIAEYAHIHVKRMSALLGTMLVADAVSITLTVSLISMAKQNAVMAAITLLVFAVTTGIVLSILAHRYIDSVNYRFALIEDSQMDAIARVAKKFYFPFMICFVANIVLAVLGSAVLVALVV
jgi:hypothetical protein